MDLPTSLVGPQYLPLALRCMVLVMLTVTPGVLTFAQMGDQPLAVVNGHSISEKEVEALVVAQTLPLQEKLYAIRKAALENLITARVLEIEAKKRGVSVAELRNQLAAGDIHVTPSEVESAYSENASFFASMSPDEAKERLRLDLETQQRMQHYRIALAKLRDAAIVHLLIQEPRLPEVGDLPQSHSIGPANARVTVVEFSDFHCPYCRTAQSTIKQLLERYPNDVRLVFKHLPLQLHGQAFAAAQAAFCAGEQNRFWPFHDALFVTSDLSHESLQSIALQVGLDYIKFQKCLASEGSATAIRASIGEARLLGINSTPTFVINRKLVRGSISFDEFKSIVDRELKTAESSSQSRQPQPARKGPEK